MVKYSSAMGRMSSVAPNRDSSGVFNARKNAVSTADRINSITKEFPRIRSAPS